jgi:hypothetical protein
MLTPRQYTEYLIATTDNYTCTNLADHLIDDAQVSHDCVSDFLAQHKLTPRLLWTVVAPKLQDGPDSSLILDDRVQNKQYSKKIALVKLQYSGAEHGLVRGIGVLNLVHANGQEHGYYPIDYRIYDPTGDGKTKNMHFREMLIRAISDKGLQAHTILFDSWYGSVDNLKLIQRLGRVFVTTLKSNRKVSLLKDLGYVHLSEVEWTPERLLHGVLVKLKEVPFYVRLFKLVATNGDIEWVIPNRPDDPHRPIPADVVHHACDMRWQIEQMHREVKQLVGTEKCQCRKARSQRNHLACCYLAWVAILQRAQELGTTLYKAVAALWDDYLIQELRHPTIKAVWGA